MKLYRYMSYKEITAFFEERYHEIQCLDDTPMGKDYNPACMYFYDRDEELKHQRDKYNDEGNFFLCEFSFPFLLVRKFKEFRIEVERGFSGKVTTAYGIPYTALSNKYFNVEGLVPVESDHINFREKVVREKLGGYFADPYQSDDPCYKKLIGIDKHE